MNDTNKTESVPAVGVIPAQAQRLTLRRIWHNPPGMAIGAQPGNQNAAKPKGQLSNDFFSMRCRGAEKAKWVRAANKAKRENHLTHEGSSVLTTWVIQVLNHAAAKE